MAARHLKHYGYQPTVFYPKRSKNELYQVCLGHPFLFAISFDLRLDELGLCIVTVIQSDYIVSGPVLLG